MRFDRAIFVALAVLGSALVFVLLIGGVVRFYSVPSEAMNPTLPRGCHVVVTRISHAARGDIVTFIHPLRRQTYMSRVVATANDVVELRAKQLYVNGEMVREPYVVHEDPRTYPHSSWLPEPYRSRDHFGPFRVPSDSFFVLGDNRDDAFDSRFWGALPRANLLGRVRLAYSSARGVWAPSR
ncbi:MAG TPA: signal peptidase I [Thermoanaerobaculia bacterium]|nr:signal peptidase I [Thermoanaerobaculia bacterium]